MQKNVLVRKLYHRRWSGCLSLFAHMLLKSVGFFFQRRGRGRHVLVSEREDFWCEEGPTFSLKHKNWLTDY